MMAVAAANVYICANILLLLAGALLFGLRTLCSKLSRPIAFHHQLKCGYALTVAAIVLPLVSFNAGYDERLTNTAQIWSAPTMRGWSSQTTMPRTAISLTTSSSAVVPLNTVGLIAKTLLLAGALFALFRIAIDAYFLARILANAQTLRRCGQLKVMASSRVAIPFSCWWPGSSVIVIPTALLTHPNDCKLTLRHEGQHHRQFDTRLLYLYQLLRAVFFWNPAIHHLAKSIGELQEFTCDERLAAQGRIDVHAYSQCLLSVAETTAQRRRGLLYSSMTGSMDVSVLRKRIEAVLAPPERYIGKPVTVAVAGTAVLSMLVTAFAFATPIHDRRISVEDAERMVALGKSRSTIPIAINERVLNQLNLLLSTPDGRASIREGLERMKEHQPTLAAIIAESGLPQELLAVPLVESGYRNRLPDRDEWHGAGLWMFIKPTARAFGLTVNEGRDDRLNVAAESAAAMRYFNVLHDQFNDWGLAFLAFNFGSKQVEKAIRETGSRDVWELTRKGYENDPDYVPRVMAAILIIQNPSVLN